MHKSVALPATFSLRLTIVAVFAILNLNSAIASCRVSNMFSYNLSKLPVRIFRSVKFITSVQKLRKLETRLQILRATDLQLTAELKELHTQFWDLDVVDAIVPDADDVESLPEGAELPPFATWVPGWRQSAPPAGILKSKMHGVRVSQESNFKWAKTAIDDFQAVEIRLNDLFGSEIPFEKLRECFPNYAALIFRSRQYVAFKAHYTANWVREEYLTLDDSTYSDPSLERDFAGYLERH